MSQKANNIENLLKLAIETLKNSRQTHYYCEDTWYSCPKHEDGCANDDQGSECNCGADSANLKIDKTIKALEEALANHCEDNLNMVKQEQGEPVAESVEKLKELGWNDAAIDKANTPQQRTWVGLTDEEIKKIAKKHRWHESNVSPHLMPVFRSLEAKLKEKNT